jgi:hypothetical protein
MGLSASSLLVPPVGSSEGARIRAKSAPVQPRIVRFQAANSGFAAPHSRGYQPAESRSTVRKTAQESQESVHPGETRLCRRPDFKTGAFNRSATLPRSIKASPLTRLGKAVTPLVNTVRRNA